VEKFGSKWKDLFRLTISLASGSTARISAIHASLRPYKPSFMHFWEQKTFWHDLRVCEDDIEFHTFSEIETIPPVPRDEVGLGVRMCLDGVLELKREFEEIEKMGDMKNSSDLTSFWHRKTKKPVLACLLIQKSPDSPLQVFKGVNMEVSMPTGSLCAERNVIGSALSQDLTLKREHLKMIAVLSVSFKSSSDKKNIIEYKKSKGKHSFQSSPTSPFLKIDYDEEDEDDFIRQTSSPPPFSLPSPQLSTSTSTGQSSGFTTPPGSPFFPSFVISFIFLCGRISCQEATLPPFSSINQQW